MTAGSRAATVCVLTGAGISTDSGIPDFRGPQGVWTRNPAAERLVTLDHYLSDPGVRRVSWQARRRSPAWTAAPNPAHLALAELERAGTPVHVITQNIDGLHQRAGSSPGQVIELHGSMFTVRCVKCDDRTTMRDAVDRVAAGEDDPDCRRCGGILKSATVMFGEHLDPHTLDRAVRAARAGDRFWAIGTSLRVEPAASLCAIAAAAGAHVTIVNAEPTPYDPVADEVVRDPIGEAVPRMVGALLAG